MDDDLLTICRDGWRAGCTGVLLFIGAWGALFFLAFMIALGNETPAGRAALQVIGPVLTVANPLLGIPAAYLLFVFWKKER